METYRYAWSRLPTEYVYRLQGQRNLSKRDPIILILAFCLLNMLEYRFLCVFRIQHLFHGCVHMYLVA